LRSFIFCGLGARRTEGLTARMTSTILQLSRAGRRVAGQVKRLYGEEIKIAYNVHQTASMVSNRLCYRLGTN